MDSFDIRKYITESKDMDTYFKTAIAAAEHAKAAAEAKGVQVDENDWDRQVVHGGRSGRLRPSTGETTSLTLGLTKDGKPLKKALHIQIYGMEHSYELNYYIS